MGLKKITPAQWLMREGIATDAYIANKAEQTQLLGDGVLQVLPEAGPAVDELARLLADSVELPEVDSASSAERLYQCSMAVAEDLLLLQPGEEGYRLVAAHLCAPSHWLLEDKIGRDMDPIHAQVPGYHPGLSRSVNRFLDRLSVDALVERFNWSLDEQPNLCQRPSGQPHLCGRTLSWYRVERQTLRRLPESGAIVFGILVRQWPLWFLAQQEGARAALEAAIEELPPALRDYKSFGNGAVLNWAMEGI